MALDAHIDMLKQKHGELEAQLMSLAASPSIPDVELRSLKQQKLQLKDQISRLQSEAA